MSVPAVSSLSAGHYHFLSDVFLLVPSVSELSESHSRKQDRLKLLAG